jgi:hypothetical protein
MTGEFFEASGWQKKVREYSLGGCQIDIHHKIVEIKW